MNAPMGSPARISFHSVIVGTSIYAAPRSYARAVAMFIELILSSRRGAVQHRQPLAHFGDEHVGGPSLRGCVEPPRIESIVDPNGQREHRLQRVQRRPVIALAGSQ